MASRPTSRGDLAYYLDKRQRGFDLCIYMLGADHHGLPRPAQGPRPPRSANDPATVEVLIGQLVNLVRDGRPVRMSKRAGTVITARRPGRGHWRRCRALQPDPFVGGHRHRHRPGAVVLGVERKPGLLRAITRTPGCRALARNAAELGLIPDTNHLELLTHDKRGTLLRTISDFPKVLKTRRPCVNRTGCAATWKTSPAITTGSMTRAGCCPKAMRNPPTCTRHAWRYARPPGRSSPTGWQYSAVTAPERM